jgi:hypothetical protein
MEAVLDLPPADRVIQRARKDRQHVVKKWETSSTIPGLCRQWAEGQGVGGDGRDVMKKGENDTSGQAGEEGVTPGSPKTLAKRVERSQWTGGMSSACRPIQETRCRS